MANNMPIRIFYNNSRENSVKFDCDYCEENLIARLVITSLGRPDLKSDCLFYQEIQRCNTYPCWIHIDLI